MMTERRHLTTRRGFIAAAGFGGVTLYGSWAAYGASPSPLALFTGIQESPHEGADMPGMVMDGASGGHGGSNAGSSPSLDEFRERLSDFIERFGLPDGSVYPTPGMPGEIQAASHSPASSSASEAEMGSAGSANAHGAGHGSAAEEIMAEEEHGSPAEPVDVWLLAAQFSFEPWHLRLDTGRPYRFRMMAAETAHGASIQFGQGGRMIRLRPGVMAESQMTFHEPGEYLISCTVYCGVGHDVMQGRITVADAQGGAA